MKSPYELFTSRMIQDLCSERITPAEVVEAVNVFSGRRFNSLRGVFEWAYQQVKDEHPRGEYVFKTQFISHHLTYQQFPALVLEGRAGQSRPDITHYALDGAKGWEIKSERDSLERLGLQMVNYSQVLPAVNVLCAEVMVERVQLVCPAWVGVHYLNRHGVPVVVREAKEDVYRTDTETVLASLRLTDVKELLGYFNLDVPDVPNTQRYRAYHAAFEGIDRQKLHAGVGAVLGRSRAVEGERKVAGLPLCLWAVALRVKLTSAQRYRLVKLIDQQV